jgi:uncharacterized protein with HEPN domain
MYNDNNLIYILTILENIEKIWIYTDGVSSYEKLLEVNDQLNYNGVQHLELVIGEEVKKIDAGLKAEFQAIPWPSLVTMRNFLAHDYRGVDPEIVFKVATEYLEPLKDALIQMIDRIDYTAPYLLKFLDSTYYPHIQYLRTKLID